MSSARQTIERHRRVEFEQRERLLQREAEDREQYQSYVNSMRSEAQEPLSFEQWLQFIPADLLDQPAPVRGAAASAASNWKRCVSVTRERVASAPLDDAELADVGFDLNERPEYEIDYTPAAVAASFESFQQTDARFVPSLHFRALGDFCYRNRLMLSVTNILKAFELLLSMHIIEHVKPPEPQPTPERLVDFRAEPGPETERFNRIRDYEEKPVVRYDNRDFTQKQLDALSSEEYLKVMRVPRYRGVLPPTGRL